MKPLQMLDHVMLWIARAYALFFFGNHLARWIKYATEPMPLMPPAAGTVTYHGPTISLGISVLLSGILTVGLFLLGRRLAWLFVIPPALGIMVMNLYWTGRLLFLVMGASYIKPSFYSTLEMATLGCAMIVIIQLANIYLAFRLKPGAKNDGAASFPPSLVSHSF